MAGPRLRDHFREALHIKVMHRITIDLGAPVCGFVFAGPMEHQAIFSIDQPIGGGGLLAAQYTKASASISGLITSSEKNLQRGIDPVDRKM